VRINGKGLRGVVDEHLQASVRGIFTAGGIAR
jgi:hypothetical protein